MQKTNIKKMEKLRTMAHTHTHTHTQRISTFFFRRQRIDVFEFD